MLKQFTQAPEISYMNDRMCSRVIESRLSFVGVRPATSPKELRSAFEIVYREYFQKGYCPVRLSGMHFTAHNLLPGARTFLLKGGEKTLGTISLIVDTPCGLPIESADTEIAGRLRAEGKKIAEAGLLSFDNHAINENVGSHRRLSCIFWLFQALLNYTRSMTQITNLLISVHPNHEVLYRYLGFYPVAIKQRYSLAGGNPGILMTLDIPRLERELPKNCTFRRFFFRSREEVSFCHPGIDWTAQSLDKFTRHLNAVQRAGHFSGPHEYLKRRYPKMGYARALISDQKFSGHR